ncbi:MAG: OmpA family protein, partial [Deltaproteobacteria bacterium]|nr:OmpA family protein [Deltaproteobacteria bacterium]
CVFGAKLREDAKLIEQKVANARERGAFRCAPAELARAEANLEFLEYELTMGDFRRASRHHRAALQNIDRAIEMSDPNECAEKRVLIGEEKPLVITKTDRDGDGIMDDVDQCPDEPEDFDTFQDEDGCPDPDNDADTVLDVNDKCPMEPGDPANQGCPVIDKDTDGDGLMDSVDQCPNDPEDKDGFQDEDGCPDPDNDQDTVLDVVDACPLEPGSPMNNGCPVKDRDGDGITDDVDQCPDVPGPAPTGCPKRVLVVKKDDRIEIKQQINFKTGKHTSVGRISFESLDQVAAVMKSNPEIKIVIEGHTDSVGAADYNLRLSDGRAHAVRDALIERGVDAGR